MPRLRKPDGPFRHFNSSPEINRLEVKMCVRFPHGIWDVDDFLAERSIDNCHEKVRFYWNRLGPMFIADIKRQRISGMRGFCNWRWHVDGVFVTRRAA